jgi:EmrB/QacA subfamily drug resistance transporter
MMVMMQEPVKSHFLHCCKYKKKVPENKYLHKISIFDEKKMDSRQKTALSIAVLSSFLTPFMGSSLNIALPSMGREFSMNAVMISWIATAYLLSAAILLIPVGKLADMYGRKLVFLSGMIIFTFSSLLGALAPTGTIMLLSRIIQGIGSTMIFGTSMAILTAVFPPGVRGRAIGLNSASVYLGLSLGPFIGGLLTEHFGWRSIFWIMIPVGILTIYLVAKHLQGEWADDKKQHFDLKGALVYAFALVGIMLGFSELGNKYGILILGAGLLLLGYFLYLESSIKYPMLDINIFRKNKVFSYSNLAALINYSATFAIIFLLSLYLQDIRGFSPQRSGLIIFTQPLIMALVSPFSGKLSDRFEPRIIATWGMSVCTAGLAAFVFLRPDTPILFIILNLMVLGFGFALFSSPNTNAVMSSVDKKNLGIASAMLGTMRLTGQMLSMGIAMLLLSVFIGKESISISNQESFMLALRTAYLIFSVLCFGGIFASSARGNMNKYV